MIKAVNEAIQNTKKHEHCLVQVSPKIDFFCNITRILIKNYSLAT